MNTEQINSLFKNLNSLYADNKFKNAYIVMFGANKPADRSIQFLREHSIETDTIIDNNPLAWGQRKFGVMVASPESVLKEYKENAVILIASKYYDQMCAQLVKMGYKKGKHIFQTIKFTDYDISEDTAKIYELQALTGLELYQSLKRKYGEDVQILISPCSGLGDVYLIGKYLNVYLKKYNIQNYVLVVVGNGSKKVIDLYGLSDRTLLMSQEQIDSLAKCSSLLGNAVNINVLLHCYRPTDILEGFELIQHRINWGDLYKYALFGLDKSDGDGEEPIYPDLTKEVQVKLLGLGAKKGKSVLLAPYATSLTSISDFVWEEVAQRLTDAGYRVFTNCFGKTEYPIKGTQPINFTVSESKSILEYMGAFIGLRSGICDIVSGINCKKVIIYPDDFSKHFYSLNGMRLCDDAVEIVNGAEKETIEECLRCFDI